METKIVQTLKEEDNKERSIELLLMAVEDDSNIKDDELDEVEFEGEIINAMEDLEKSRRTKKLKGTII